MREALRLQVRDRIYVPATCRARRRSLAATDFTIISNNCWAGTVYESYDLRKETPTVGMFIMPEDFLELVSDLRGNLARPLEFVPPERSKWERELTGTFNWGNYPIGRLGDIELHMLHHHGEEAARKKWESRVPRVNYDKILFKLNDQNGCTTEQARRFDDLPLDHKVFFTVRDLPGEEHGDTVVRVRAPRGHEYIRASYEPVGRNRSFDVTGYLNRRFADR